MRVLFVALALMLAAPPLMPADARVPSSRDEITLSFAPLVKRAAPAVVNIYASRRNKTGNDPLARFFFGEGASKMKTKPQRSLGSGVIVDSSGVIITCHHVIEDSEDIKVILQDKQEFSAKLMYSDEKTDLAVLKIENGSVPLPYLEMMDSDDLEVGDLVLAIGNPFGVGQTVTNGIVSALARTAVGVTDYSFFIQTDASINPGNSGGALVSMDGKLAGINTAIYSRSGGSNGIGFAIPANMAKAVTNSVVGYGKIIRPWLGVETQDVTKNIADALGLRLPQGALVKSVFPGGPAAAAGLRQGDVIIAIGKHQVPDQHALRFRVATFSPEERTELTVFRNGSLQTLPVRLQPPAENPPRDRIVLNGGFSPFGGMVVVNISPAVAEEFSLDYGLTGVMIENVPQDAPAARTGLQPGDVIAAVNGTEITDTKLFDRLLRVTRSRSWTATIVRDNKVVNMQWLN